MHFLLTKRVLIILGISLITKVSFALNSTFDTRAHRGGRENTPENIIPAFITGIKSGADSLELDIHVTSDNQIVVSHDSNLARQCLTSDGKKILYAKPIIQMPLKEVQSFDCGSTRDPEFPKQVMSSGARIPKLNDVLDLLERKDLPNADKVKVAIEIKIWPGHPELTPSKEKIAAQLVKLLNKKNMSKRVAIISFDPEVLQKIKDKNSSIETQLLIGAEGGGPKLFKELADPKQRMNMKISAVLPYWEMLTKENVKAFHDKGIKVIPWTPNKSNDWKKLIDMGVDGITTDDPKGLLELKKSLEGKGGTGGTAKAQGITPAVQ